MRLLPPSPLLPALIAALLLAAAGGARAVNNVHRHHHRYPAMAPHLPAAPKGVVKKGKAGKAGTPALAKGPLVPHLNYYGGPVLSSVRIVPVFWGPKVDPAVTARIGAFY